MPPQLKWLNSSPAQAAPVAPRARARSILVRAFAELEAEAVLLGFNVTVLLRVLAYNLPLRLPAFPAHAIYSPEARLQSHYAATHLNEEASVYRSSVWRVPPELSETLV